MTNLIEKSPKRIVSGDDVVKALEIGLTKILKEKVDPASIVLADVEGCAVEDFSVSCNVTGSARKPRKPKGEPSA